MRRATVPILTTIALVGLAGCNVAKPASQTFGLVDVSVPDAPEVVIRTIAAEAAQNGFVATPEGSRALYVDFGVSQARVPVPTRYGIWGSRVTWRDTRVASNAFYEAFPSGSGTRLRMVANPIYWHPDIGTWLPGPYDVNPGSGLLASVSGDAAMAAELPIGESHGLERVTHELDVGDSLGDSVDGLPIEDHYEIEEIVIEMEDAAYELPAASATPPVPTMPPALERLPTPPHLKGK